METSRSLGSKIRDDTGGLILRHLRGAPVKDQPVMVGGAPARRGGIRIGQTATTGVIAKHHRDQFLFTGGRLMRPIARPSLGAVKRGALAETIGWLASLSSLAGRYL